MTEILCLNHCPSSDEEEEEEDSVSDSASLVSLQEKNGGCGNFSEGEKSGRKEQKTEEHHHMSLLALLADAFRKSVLTCSSTGTEESLGPSFDIGWPTNVRHAVHVTFDRFQGFCGLPVELQLEMPRRVPSASASVFGVSAESMQCSYDSKGNSVPTILLLMQKRLYSIGGLKVEGIFRINAENSQEENMREYLNRGVVPHDIDPHCLAGLIKAWFRELPVGVLDSLAHEQMMKCNSEQECLDLVKALPPTQAALLDWAINLMTDVVQEEQCNKMNSRNIALVFAPNMTQMADPLTALMFAVQVMNFLKRLIMRSLKQRKEAVSDPLQEAVLGNHNDDDNRTSKTFLPHENKCSIECGTLSSLLNACSPDIKNISGNQYCAKSFTEGQTTNGDTFSSVMKKEKKSSNYEPGNETENEESNSSKSSGLYSGKLSFSSCDVHAIASKVGSYQGGYSFNIAESFRRTQNIAKKGGKEKAS